MIYGSDGGQARPGAFVLDPAAPLREMPDCPSPIRPQGSVVSESVLDQAGGPVTATCRILCSGFATEMATSDGKVVLRLYGELDMVTAPALAGVVDTSLDSKPVVISPDLSEVTFVDSTGLNVFVSAHRRATTVGCSFGLRSPRRAVLRRSG